MLIHARPSLPETSLLDAVRGVEPATIGHIVDAREVAYLVAFLCSPKSRAVNGDAIAAGGGVRGPEDLGRVASAGCDGALVATALHDGRLGSRDIAGARRLGHDKLTR